MLMVNNAALEAALIIHKKIFWMTFYWAHYAQLICGPKNNESLKILTAAFQLVMFFTGTKWNKYLAANYWFWIKEMEPKIDFLFWLGSLKLYSFYKGWRTTRNKFCDGENILNKQFPLSTNENK